MSNPKLHKERIRTSAQRPDIVIAFQNHLRKVEARSARAARITDVREMAPRRTA
jgi:hypothetical protein